MPPLWGLDLRGSVFLQRYHPYGIQERFEGSKVSDQSLVRWGMQVTNVKLSHCEAKFGLRVWETKFGRVRRDAHRIWASTPQKPNLPDLGRRRLFF